MTAEIYRRENNNISDQDRRFITMLVQGTVRLSGRLDWELKQVFHGDYKDLKEGLQILLRLGVFQLFYMDNVPNYAAVTTTVQIAKQIHPKLGGLTNALLRSLDSIEYRSLPDKNTSIEDVASYLSHPLWLINKWVKDRSLDEAKALAEWNNEYPQLWFRVNTLKYTSVRFKNYLKKQNITYKQFKYIPIYFQTSKHQELLKSDIFIEGKISVQDPSAGLVVELLDPVKDDSIIDVCAAPGGKSSYIAEKLNNTGSILSYDSNADRLKRLDKTLERLHINNTMTDLVNITEDKIPMTDKMLIDVPCSGTGVMAKRADIRWRRTIEDILEMHLLQRKILWAASKYINPGGVIVYSTCSIEPEENYMVIDAFLKSHSKYSIESAKNYIPSKFVDKKGAMVTFPPDHNIDGGFAVRLINNG